MTGLEFVLDDDLRKAFPALLEMPRPKLIRLLNGDFVQEATIALNAIDGRRDEQPQVASE